MLRLFREKPKVLTFKAPRSKMGQVNEEDKQEGKRQSVLELRLLLRQAFDEDEYGIVVALLGAGINLNDPIDESGKNLLHLAVVYGKIDLVKLLLEKYEVNLLGNVVRVNCQERLENGTKIISRWDKYNCLHSLCANFTNDLKMMICLLNSCGSEYEKKKFLNAFTKYRRETPLHISCRFNNYKLVRYLLSANVEYWRKDRYGRTALDIAYHFQNLKCVGVFEQYYMKKGIAGCP